MSVILITNRKSHTGFRLIPTSIISNDLERRNSPYFAFFFPPNSIVLQAVYITVVEDRPIMSEILSPSSSLTLLAKTNAPCNAVCLR